MLVFHHAVGSVCYLRVLSPCLFLEHDGRYPDSPGIPTGGSVCLPPGAQKGVSVDGVLCTGLDVSPGWKYAGFQCEGGHRGVVGLLTSCQNGPEGESEE